MVLVICACRSKASEPAPAGSASVRDAAPREVAGDVALAVSGHAVVLKSGPLPEYRHVIASAKEQAGVASAEPFVFETGSIAVVGRPAWHQIAFKGIDPTGAVPVAMARFTTSGSLAALDASTIAIGEGLAKTLGAKVGDSVEIEVGRAKGKRTLKIVATFHVVVEVYDRELAFMAFAPLQELAGSGDQATGIEVRVTDLATAKPLAQQIEKALGGAPYQVRDYRELNPTMFE
jgi:ABC-type lipoprotein release transport system permease subunit